TREALTASREARDRLWRNLRSGGFSQGGLCDHYALLVTEADTLADQRFQEAHRVARHESLHREIRHDEHLAAEAEGRLTAAQANLNQWDKEWKLAWQPCGITPGDPEAMLSWLESRERLLGLWQKRTELEEERSALAGEIDLAKCSLAAALLDLGESPPGEEEGLRQLTGRSRQILERRQKARERREIFQEQLRQLAIKGEAALRRRTEATQAVEQWQGRWQRAMARLGENAEASTHEILALLELMAEIGSRRERQHDLGRRLQEIRDDLGQFQQRIAVLAAATAPDLVGQPPLTAITALSARLTKAREEARLAADWRRQRAELALRTESVEQQCHRWQADLAGLGQRLGLTNPDGLADLERRWREREDLLARLGDLERGLLEDGDGLDLEQLETECDREEADTLPGRIEELGRELGDLAHRRDALSQRLGEVEGDLARMGSGDEAARADQARESALGEMRRHGYRYLTLTAASALLGEALSRFREQHRGTLVTRAGTLFRELTGGSFQTLVVDFGEDDQPRLKAMRAGGERLGVEAMSDGSRDQLYLALRLALIEQRQEREEPLPFVVDDILVHFDDARAAQAMRALANLGKRTQVLFFTHHAHLIDVARGALEADGMMPPVHRLP
ncbi:MAG: hypothetical protein HQL57_04265, partial [Magnetococcales bacterium]|nr:hypothetical protein [Magnetococcales bacterium]